jgi:predicted transcriptional regulator
MPDIIRHTSFRVEIRRVEPPFARDKDKEIEWICQSLGLAPAGEKNHPSILIFKEIVKSTESNQGITSTELAERVAMSRGAVINQLNNLQRSGLILKQGRLYVARSRSMVRTIQEVEEDIKRIFDRMERIALEMDKEFNSAQRLE